jgi:hypothetical protein
MSMELELDKSASITMVGDVEITLPDYMTMLVQDELDECKKASNAHDLIIAAGRHPSGEIVVLSAKMQFYVMERGVFGTPDGSVVPDDCGQSIVINPGANPDFVMTAGWFIDNAERIDITYLDGENQSGKPTKVDP